jgi:sec-independent protein translocase protein TatC
MSVKYPLVLRDYKRSVFVDGIKSGKSLADHFDDLKILCIKIILTLAGASLLPVFFYDSFIAIITFPLRGTPLFFTAPADSFLFLFKVYFFFGCIISFPLIIYYLKQYFEPALHAKERKFMYVYVYGCIVLSYIALLYGYFSLLPASLEFLLGITPKNTEFIITAEEYLNFIISTLSILVLVFQTPIIVYGLTSSGIVSKAAFMQKRKILYFGAVVTLAVLTPSADILSLVLIFLPIALLFEAALFFSPTNK